MKAELHENIIRLVPENNIPRIVYALKGLYKEVTGDEMPEYKGAI